MNHTQDHMTDRSIQPLNISNNQNGSILEGNINLPISNGEESYIQFSPVSKYTPKYDEAFGARTEINKNTIHVHPLRKISTQAYNCTSTYSIRNKTITSEKYLGGFGGCRGFGSHRASTYIDISKTRGNNPKLRLNKTSITPPPRLSHKYIHLQKTPNSLEFVKYELNNAHNSRGMIPNAWGTVANNNTTHTQIQGAGMLDNMSLESNSHINENRSSECMKLVPEECRAPSEGGDTNRGDNKNYSSYIYNTIITTTPTPKPGSSTPWRFSEKAYKMFRKCVITVQAALRLRKIETKNLHSLHDLEQDIVEYLDSPRARRKDREQVASTQAWMDDVQKDDYLFYCIGRGTLNDLKRIKKMFQTDIRYKLFAVKSKENIINKQNPRNGQTPLYASCLYGNVNVVSLLLSLGADPHRKSAPDTQTEESNLEVAARWGFIDVVGVLLDIGGWSNKLLISSKKQTTSKMVREMIVEYIAVQQSERGGKCLCC